MPHLRLLFVASALVGASCSSSDTTAVDVEVSGAASMSIASSAVVDGALLDDFQCERKENDIEASIPLAWSGVPSEAASIAIAMHHYPNPDDTTKANSYHAIWGVDPSVSEVGHGAAGAGDWFLGSNKDGTAISYTSPCSPDASVAHEYTITLYALSATPADLPAESSLAIDRDALVESFETVSVLDTTTLTFATG